MSKKGRMLAALIGLGLAVGAVAVVASRDSGQGAATAEQAVSELLAAATESDSDRARNVVFDIPDEDLIANLGEISEFVQGAGGLDILRVSEDGSQRMGSSSVVNVLIEDSTLKAFFNVGYDGKGYRVAVGDAGSSGMDEGMDMEWTQEDAPAAPGEA